MKQKDYLYKDLVGEYMFTTIGKESYKIKTIEVNGREYEATCKCQSLTAIAQIYKIWDSDEKKYVHKLFVGVVKQHPRERCVKKIAIEQAKIKVLTNPDMVVDWDKTNTFRMLADFVEHYMATIPVKPLQTSKEILDSEFKIEFDCCKGCYPKIYDIDFED